MKNMQNWFENKNNMHLQEKQILYFLYLSNRSLFYLSSKNFLQILKLVQQKV